MLKNILFFLFLILILSLATLSAFSPLDDSSSNDLPYLTVTKTTNVTTYYNVTNNYYYNITGGGNYSCINSSNITCIFDGTNWMYYLNLSITSSAAGNNPDYVNRSEAGYYNSTNVNASIDNKLSGNIWYFVKNYTQYGTAIGDLNLTWNYGNYDDNSYNLTEVVVNGLLVYMNTSNTVTTNLNKVCIRYKSSGDTFNLDLYDNSVTWETYLQLTPISTFNWVCNDIRDPSNHIHSGIVPLRIISTGSAATTHHLEIDALYLSSGYVPHVGTEVDPVWSSEKSNYFTTTQIDNASIVRYYNLSWIINNVGNATANNLSMQSYIDSNFQSINYHNQNLNTTNDVTFNSINTTNKTGWLHIEGGNISFYNATGSLVNKFYKSGSTTISTTGTFTIGGSLTVSSTMTANSDIWTSGVGDNFWLWTSTEALSKFHAFGEGNLNMTGTLYLGNVSRASTTQNKILCIGANQAIGICNSTMNASFQCNCSITI